jgi:hypothetical protein
MILGLFLNRRNCIRAAQDRAFSPGAVEAGQRQSRAACATSHLNIGSQKSHELSSPQARLTDMTGNHARNGES